MGYLDNGHGRGRGLFGLGMHLNGSGLPGSVRFVSRQQPHHEAYQFACGEHEGAFVPMGAHFVVLALVVGRIFWGAQSGPN